MRRRIWASINYPPCMIVRLSKLCPSRPSRGRGGQYKRLQTKLKVIAQNHIENPSLKARREKRFFGVKYARSARRRPNSTLTISEQRLVVASQRRHFPISPLGLFRSGCGVTAPKARAHLVIDPKKHTKNVW